MSDSQENWRPGPGDCVRLLRQADPAVIIESINVLGEGWDSVAFLLNGELVVRIPKRPDVDRALRRERALLAAIAGILPAPVPDCTLLAENLPGFPSGIGAYPLIEGTPLDQSVALSGDGDRLAQELAAFLRVLHDIDACSLPAGLLETASMASWWQDRWQLYTTVVPVIEQRIPAGASRAVRRGWEDAFAQAQRGGFDPVLIHGDLAPEHLLVHERGGLAGVIDFGDATLGDSALDFAGLPDHLAARVVERYEEDELARRNLHVRRRFYWLTVPFHAIRAGLSWRRDDLIEEGLNGLSQRYMLEQ